IFKASGLKSLQSDRALQRAAIKAGRLPPDTVPLEASEAFRQTINANAVRTVGTLKKLTGTMATDATGQLNKYMDQAQLMVQSGAFTHEQAVKAAVEKFAADGVFAFDYSSGVRTSIEAAVRRALVTGVNQANAEISLSNASELETDLVEVTSHADARPEHAAFQGKIFSMSGMHPKYKKLSAPMADGGTGYGTGAGLCGWNCRHSFFAYIEGVSEQLPKEKYEKETYEQEQVARYNERKIREWKRKAATLEAGGQDSGIAKKKVKEWQERQAAHIKKTGLRREYERERIYGK
ncbi:MAG: phage minor capsid protein, partial [Bacillota bacterium]